jgi:parallel beta-helix repeat protein
MGVIVSISAGDDPDNDTLASLAYRQSGSGPYHQGFPLSRVTDTRFVGSLFWLDPGMSYDVRVNFDDPDGDALDGTSVEATGTTRPSITFPAPSHTYYASPAGNGTDCTLASPCLLEEAISQAGAGEAVSLRNGIYATGEIDLPRSGTVGAPITISSYPGEMAILDGGDPATFTWASQGGGVYHALVNAADPHLITADGQRLYPYQSLFDLENLAWAIPGFYASGTDVYVRLAGDANPSAAVMVVSRYNYAFYVEQDFIYFSKLTFRHYGQGEYAKAIYFHNASNNLVQGCIFAINDLGIGLKYDSGRNVIQDNVFNDTDFDWPWDAVKTGSALETGGIRFYAPTDGRGNIIRSNTFHDYFDGFGACPDSSDAVTNETDVYENLVYRAGDDGMETDGQCSNVRIWGNTFHDVLVGISLAPVYTGPVYAIRNLMYNTGAGNNDYPGSPFKFNSGYDQSGPMYLLHNTADAALPGSSGLDIKSPGSWTSITARNNIWAGTEYALSNANPDQPLDLDYDDLYTTLVGELAWWDNLPDRHLNTLAELQSATGQENHGFNLLPDFVDPAVGDYTLAPASGLIDAGLLIAGINDDYAGDAPDVGAFEFTGYGFTLQVQPTSRAIDPGGTALYTIDVQPIRTFTDTITLSVVDLPVSLTASIEPETFIPPGQATLTVTDTHSAPLDPGIWYDFTVSAEGGGTAAKMGVWLLVGGVEIFLPVVYSKATATSQQSIPHHAPLDGGDHTEMFIATFETGKQPAFEIHVATNGHDDTGDGSLANPYASLERAAQDAAPGAAIRIHAGTYAGGIYLEDLAGTAEAPIWIGGAPGETRPVIEGGDEGIHLVRARYVIVHDLEVRNPSYNGINSDDGGDYANPEAAKDLIFHNLYIHHVGGTGNQDCLKLSGVNDYYVLDSEFAFCGGGDSGSGIDHVGCHQGVITGNFFHDTSANAIAEEISVRRHPHHPGCDQKIMQSHRHAIGQLTLKGVHHTFYRIHFCHYSFLLLVDATQFNYA